MSLAPSPTVSGVILAGGLGTRLWPLSRVQHPKQVLPLLEGGSLLCNTIECLLPKIPQAHLGVVSIASQADVIRLELHRHGWHDIQLWLEPWGRDTAPALALAALLMGPSHDSEIMAVFPADQVIKSPASLYSALDQGAILAQAGYMVTLGISPAKVKGPHSYIKAGDLIESQGPARQVVQFSESAERQPADLPLGNGCYWHSGIFMIRRDVFLETFAQCLPNLMAELSRSISTGQAQLLEETYRHYDNIPFDNAVLECFPKVAVLPVDLGTGGVDDWDHLYELSPKDDRGNVRVGSSFDLESRNSFVFAPNRLVATIGLTDMVVVDTADALLICPRNRASEVEKVVAELSREPRQETVQHPTVERPWGSYTVTDSGPGFQVKQIVVAPGKRLSLQLHRYRAEHWVVVQGQALVTIGRETKLVPPNESVYIPVETVHRLENPGSEPVRLIEVQTGSYLGEDDIVRLADDYWRTAKELATLPLKLPENIRRRQSRPTRAELQTPGQLPD